MPFGACQQFRVYNIAAFTLFLPFSASSPLFYYEGNIVRNLQERYDGITGKSNVGCFIGEGGFLMSR